MKKRLQVFISSTYTDLIDERQAAVKAILDAGHIPAGMELFKSGNESQLKTIYKWIDESDVYMLILGGRYGSIESKSGKSYTQLEYEYALSNNIPIFAVVLSSSFLTDKINVLGLNNVMEQNAPDKYLAFKSFVMEKIIRPVDDCKDIELTIHTTLNEFISEYNLVGWVKSNSIVNDYSNMIEYNLYQNNVKLVEELLKRNYPFNINECITDFSSVLSNQLKTIFNNPYGILKSSERNIRLDFVDSSNDIIRVTITKVLNYIYLNYVEHPFVIQFNATEQQALTFKVLSLVIDGEDYASKVSVSASRQDNRGQFVYRVKSNEIDLHSSNSTIISVTSYECPAIDFFQSHRINCLCKLFRTTIFLSEEIKQRYSLLCSTFSPFSKIYFDDYKAGEVLKPYDEQISLPEWSLPGSGYIATLKYKTKDNHI